MITDMTTTATAHRPNTYAGSCGKCHEHVEAGQGFIYKNYPFHSSPWFVKCGDLDSCATRVDAAEAAVKADAAARRSAKPEVVEAIALGEANLHLPKTIVISWGDADGQSVTITRRNTKTGCRLTNPFEGTSNAAPYDSEAEAVAAMIRRLRIAARPVGIGDADQIAAIEEVLEMVNDPA
jgi:hypothetical protein